MNDRALDRCDAIGLGELVRRGELTARELTEWAIERIEQVNPALNAVIHTDYDRARERASGKLPDGPFTGVPFLLKDLLAAEAGQPLTSGSRFLRDYRPRQDAELVRRQLASGLIVLGRTNTPEFGLLPTTEPELFGVTRNPWDPDRTAGGSSGGSAAAVAARMLPMAGGGDGGGSIRIPASCCGVFGLKPTRGRTPNGPGLREYWLGCTVQHALTITVRDSAALLDATAGPEVGSRTLPPAPGRPFLELVDQPPRRLKIAFTSQPLLGTWVHPDCVAALERTVKLLEGLGHQLTEAQPALERHAVAQAFVTMLCADCRVEIQEAEQVTGRKATSREFETATWVLALLGDQLSAADLNRATRAMDRTAEAVGVFFQTYDVLLTPTLSEPPVLTGSLALSGLRGRLLDWLGRLNAGKVIHALGAIEASADENFEFVPYTTPFNVTGQPAMSVPLEWNLDGLPIGLHFVGRFGDEATLFQLAGELELARPWANRVPPINALRDEGGDDGSRA